MSKIGYGYGSEWHLLRYLGYHRKVLSEKVIDLVYRGEDKSIEWFDFKFSGKNERLNRDRELEGLEFLSDNKKAMDKWETFWPKRCQHWDAVGRVDYGSHQEWLLVEAKAHIDEGKAPCRAEEVSKDKITTALEKTRKEFGGNQPVDNWLGQYYQYANRLAVLYFLMKECNPPVKARIVFINFCGDKREDAICPQNADEWNVALDRIRNSLGINAKVDLMKRVHHLLPSPHIFSNDR